MGPFKDIGVDIADLVATIEIRRPPHNYFDIALIREIAGALEALDQDPAVRAVVLAAQGKAFCAGAKLDGGANVVDVLQEKAAKGDTGTLYAEAVRTFRTRKPIVGAIHGAAVGGGLGLALVPDLRVTCPEARFCANFTRLGFHPGFGLTVTLPELIGPSKAALMFHTGRRFTGEEAFAMGLADVLVARDRVRAAATELAAEIAQSAPLGVMATRGRCAPALPSAWGRPPAASLPRRCSCAPPTISAKASPPWPSAACRASWGDKIGADSPLRRCNRLRRRAPRTSRRLACVCFVHRNLPATVSPPHCRVLDAPLALCKREGSRGTPQGEGLPHRRRPRARAARRRARGRLLAALAAPARSCPLRVHRIVRIVPGGETFAHPDADPRQPLRRQRGHAALDLPARADALVSLAPRHARARHGGAVLRRAGAPLSRCTHRPARRRAQLRSDLPAPGRELA